MKPVEIKLRGVRYLVTFVKKIHSKKEKGRHNKDAVLGDCDNPKLEKPRIRIVDNDKTTEKVLCEIALHELLHACLWDIEEVSIEETARSIQRALYRLGFRLVKKNQVKKPKTKACR